MLKRVICTLVVVSGTWSGCYADTPIDSDLDDDRWQVRQVDKIVADFPEEEDLSTPESAYAYISHRCALGDRNFWRRISVNRLAKRLPSGPLEPSNITPENAAAWLNTRIVEVRIYKGAWAVALARIPGSNGIDIRTLERVDGRWLNLGNDGRPDLDQARAWFTEYCAAREDVLHREPVGDPEALQTSLVEFLELHGREPKAFVLDTLAVHRLVIMGEVHHRPRYWSFNTSLVTDPLFPQRVGVIYMELPSNHAAGIASFLASEELDTAPVIAMLRDMLWMGWPDQPMLDFFIAVWEVNQGLPAERRLRIVPVDMPRPWSEIQNRGDWHRYESNRDRLMATNILEDMRGHADDERHTLFIVGVGHAMLDMVKPGRASPIQSAGWHLHEALGEDVYAIFPHQPVQTNMGQVYGRLGLGLFESAFEAIDHRPIAFTLRQGPFGEQPFDAMPDSPTSATCLYRDGYSTYLYLGTLEDEVFSPIIPGFYTDEHVLELDRRHRMMFGKGWAEAYGKPLTAEVFSAWMGDSWGQPRTTWQRDSLGPLNAWWYGDDWEQIISAEKYKDAEGNPEHVREAVRELFRGISEADYDAFLADAVRGWPDKTWKQFPESETGYQVYTDYPGYVMWVCRTLKASPIEEVKLDEVFTNDQGLPSVPYSLRLEDGNLLKGELPLAYNARTGQWYGMHGLDWHLNR